MRHERRPHEGPRRGRVGPRPHRAGGVRRPRRDHGRRGRGGADRRPAHRPAHEGGDARGDRGARPHDARARRAGDDDAATTSSTPRAPAAGGRRSTSPRPPRSSPRAPAARWPSTATAPRPGCRDRPTCSRRWACGSTSARSRSGAAWTRSASGSCSLPHTTARRGTSSRCAARSAVRTIFNFLGPLTNPAGARRQLIGVSDAGYLETMAGALAQLGVDRALVVSSTDGLDELSIAAPTQVVEVNGTKIDSYTVSPEDVGLPTTTDPQATAGGDPAVNARITRAILVGEDGPATRSRGAERRRRDLRRRRRARLRGGRHRGAARRSRTARRRRPSSGSSP